MRLSHDELSVTTEFSYSIIRATQFFEFVKGIADFPPTATKYACHLRSSSYGG